MSAPPMGWYADPGGRAQLRYWDGYQWTSYLAPLPVYGPQLAPLDAAIARMKQQDPRPWGWRPVVVPIVAMVAIIAAGQFISSFAPSDGTGRLVFVVIINLVLEGAVVAALYFSGREIAARHGGWGATFGWRRPRWMDLGIGLLGFFASMSIRLGLGVLLGVLTDGRANREASNVDVGTINLPTVLLLVAVVVIAAPLTEELLFRGLLLRTFMQRWSFWPSALLSTAIFGLFHTYEVGTLLGATTLALTVSVLGLVNCFLVWRTDRLMPGIVVHMASNGLVVLVLVLTANN